MWYIGQEVRSPYGRGLICSIRASSPSTPDICTLIVQPTDWQLAQGQPPTYYLNPSDVSPNVTVGDEVITPYGGAGYITSMKISPDSSSCIYTVRLRHWHLATGLSPTLYLNPSSFTKVGPPLVVQKPEDKLPSESKFSVEYKKVVVLRDQAKSMFLEKDYRNAKDTYLLALNLLQAIEGEFADDEKAKIYETVSHQHCRLIKAIFN